MSAPFPAGTCRAPWRDWTFTFLEMDVHILYLLGPHRASPTASAALLTHTSLLPQVPEHSVKAGRHNHRANEGSGAETQTSCPNDIKWLQLENRGHCPMTYTNVSSL